MSVRLVMALVLSLAFAPRPVDAQNPPAKKPDPTAELLAKLRKSETLARIDPISLAEVAEYVSAKFGVKVFINEEAFKAQGTPNPSELKVSIPDSKDMALKTSLTQVLTQAGATYLVRKEHIEIVPIAFAAKETKNVASTEEEGTPRLSQPLVSMIFKEKPLNEAIAELAEEYDLTVIVSPQSGDARTGFVTARLLNIPADKALDLLAVQSDLRVVRKGNAFLITSRDHANDMFNERMERERQKIELEKFRAAPLPKPEPQPQPIPVPVPVPVPNPPKP